MALRTRRRKQRSLSHRQDDAQQVGQEQAQNQAQESTGQHDHPASVEQVPGGIASVAHHRGEAEQASGTVRLLSLDAPGADLVSIAEILVALEKDSGQPIHRQFHAIAASSASALLAALLVANQPAAAPKKTQKKNQAEAPNPGPRSAADILKLAKSFGSSLSTKGLKPNARVKAAFSASQLAKLFEDQRLSACQTDLIIPATNAETGELVMLSGWLAKGWGGDNTNDEQVAVANPSIAQHDLRLKDLVAAASSTLGYHSPHPTAFADGSVMALTDASMSASNPAPLAIAHIREVFGPTTGIELVSLASGPTQSAVKFPDLDRAKSATQAQLASVYAMRQTRNQLTQMVPALLGLHIYEPEVANGNGEAGYWRLEDEEAVTTGASVFAPLSSSASKKRRSRIAQLCKNPGTGPYCHLVTHLTHYPLAISEGEWPGDGSSDVASFGALDSQSVDVYEDQEGVFVQPEEQFTEAPLTMDDQPVIDDDFEETPPMLRPARAPHAATQTEGVAVQYGDQSGVQNGDQYGDAPPIPNAPIPPQAIAEQVVEEAPASIDESSGLGELPRSFGQLRRPRHLNNDD